jgi:hypothetical protein
LTDDVSEFLWSVFFYPDGLHSIRMCNVFS